MQLIMKTLKLLLLLVTSAFAFTGCVATRPLAFEPGTVPVNTWRGSVLTLESPFSVTIVNNSDDEVQVRGLGFDLIKVAPHATRTLSFNHNHINFSDRFYLTAKSLVHPTDEIATYQVYFYVRSFYRQENDRQERLWRIDNRDLHRK